MKYQDPIDRALRVIIMAGIVLAMMAAILIVSDLPEPGLIGVIKFWLWH